MSNVNLKPFLIEELQHFYFVLKTLTRPALLPQVDIKFDSAGAQWELGNCLKFDGNN